MVFKVRVMFSVMNEGIKIVNICERMRILCVMLVKWKKNEIIVFIF